MAWILQLDESNYSNSFQRFPKINDVNQLSKQVAIGYKLFIKFIRTQNLNYFIEQRRGQDVQSVAFILRLLEEYEILYKISMHFNDDQLDIKIVFIFESKLTSAKSHMLLKKIIKDLKNINQMISKTIFFLISHPVNGQIFAKLRINIKLLKDSNFIFQFLKIVMKKSQQVFSIFIVFIFHSFNLLSSQKFKIKLPQIFKNQIFGKTGTFTKSDNIKELMSLVNCNLQNYQSKSSHPQVSAIPSFFRQIYQNKEIIEEQQRLWMKPKLSEYQQLSNSAISLYLVEKILVIPQTPCAPNDNPFIFSTISVINEQLQKEEQLSETNRLKITVLPVQYSYAISRNIDEEEDASSLNSIYQNPQKRTTFNKLMIKKTIRKKNQFKLISKLGWQKLILTNFRESRCGYFPKYYHTVQKQYKDKEGLLLDYIQGFTYFQQTQLKKLTMSLERKLYFGSHIANAVRFLESKEIAHLDLTPANIIIKNGQTIKIIDFGQSYNKETCQRRQVHTMSIQYRTGRTFPYYPPQVLMRKNSFTSKQDVYSLGVMLYKDFFGTFPYQCSESTLMEIYQTKQFNKRLFFAPQKIDYIGPPEILTSLASLIIKMLHQQEHKRPYPTWVSLIMTKLTQIL